MKIPALLVTLVWLCCTPMLGQTSSNDPVDALRSPGWNYGFFVGGSQSFANTPSVQTFLIAGRLGRVLTHQLGSNALRGSFEMAVDLIPINEFWIGGNAQYAGAIDPFIAKWNFTGGKTVSPYVAAVGGVVFSSRSPTTRLLACFVGSPPYSDLPQRDNAAIAALCSQLGPASEWECPGLHLSRA